MVDPFYKFAVSYFLISMGHERSFDNKKSATRLTLPVFTLQMTLYSSLLIAKDTCEDWPSIERRELRRHPLLATVL